MNCLIRLNVGIERSYNIRLYYEVRVVGVKSGDMGTAYTVSFKTRGRYAEYGIAHCCSHHTLIHRTIFQCSPIDWERTKRLMTGSLLCISPDNFKTLLWATVDQRDLKELSRGRIQIKYVAVLPSRVLNC